jgi:glycosyltransferase involved in cell wall biosynthesis
MANALISIIIPVYNVEKYLSRCLDSLINQSYTDLEIILVDDGAKDKSPQICNDYALKDERVHAYHKPNGGLSDARNYGIQYATGKYIAFIDSDDYVHPDYLQTLYNNAINYSADISICNFEKVIEGKEHESDSKGQVQCFNQEECMQQVLGGELELPFTTAWGKLFKREIFAILRFPKGKIHEDIFIAHLWFEKATKAVYTSAGLYYYIFREDSITSKERANTFTNCDSLDASKERLNFFKIWNSGKYKNNGYEGHITMSLGVYPRLADNLSDKKNEILEEMRSIYSMVDQGEIQLDSKLKIRLHYFVKFPRLYSRMIKLVRNF